MKGHRELNQKEVQSIPEEELKSAFEVMDASGEDKCSIPYVKNGKVFEKIVTWEQIQTYLNKRG